MHAPDKKCTLCEPEDVVIVEMMRDEHSAAPGEGYDLDSHPVSDDYLIGWGMKAFRIDPTLPDARQQLARELRKKWRRGEREGRRRPDDMLLAVKMHLVGASATDNAPTIANKIAPDFRHLAPASLVQKVQRWIRKYGRPGVSKSP